MKNSILKSGLLVLVGTMTAVTVQAESVTGVNSGSATAEARSETRLNSLISDKFFQEKFKLSWSGEYYGPAVNDPLSDIRPDGKGALEDVNVYNSVTVGYQTAPSVKAFIKPRFSWTPGFGSNADADLKMLDPRIGVSDSQFIKAGDVNIYGEAALELGLTSGSREKHKLLAPRFVLDGTYAIPESRFSLALTGISRIWIITSHESEATAENNPANVLVPTNLSSEGVTIEGYIAPAVVYQMSPTLTSNLRLELNTIRKTNSSIFAFNDDGTDVKYLLGWDITPKLNLSPYVQIDPFSKRSISSDAIIGAEFSGSIF